MTEKTFDVKIFQEFPELCLSKKHNGDAGYDIQSAEEIILLGDCIVLIRTGIKLEFGNNMVAKIESRSGLALKNITVEGGILDSNYRGEIKVILRNCGATPFNIKKGDRIAQLIFYPIIHPNFILTENLDESERGMGGFGSSGI